jgi:hypothetical protein
VFHKRQPQHRRSGSAQRPGEYGPIRVWEALVADVEALVDLLSCTGHGGAVHLDDERHEAGQQSDCPFLGLREVEGICGIVWTIPGHATWFRVRCRCKLHCRAVRMVWSRHDEGYNERV